MTSASRGAQAAPASEDRLRVCEEGDAVPCVCASPVRLKFESLQTRLGGRGPVCRDSGPRV